MSLSINDRSAYVREMANELGIVLPPEDLPKVAGVLSNLARAAGLVRDANLDESTLAAPVFRPSAGDVA
jgi:1-carboxybiuret hydrolase subunit AtzG-like